jgi:hypothetical protein
LKEVIEDASREAHPTREQEYQKKEQKESKKKIGQALLSIVSGIPFT